MDVEKKRVLILCTGNSCRSQMAEGLWRTLGGDRWDVESAGSHPALYIQPLAAVAMREIGIDVTMQRSKHVGEFAGTPFDLVITLCDNAREACPEFPGAKAVQHWPFEDPTFAAGTQEERLEAFRKTRDAIRERIKRYLAEQR